MAQPGKKFDDFVVGVVTSTGHVATIVGGERYPNEAQAFLAAKRQHEAKPHMNFTFVRVAGR